MFWFYNNLYEPVPPRSERNTPKDLDVILVRPFRNLHLLSVHEVKLFRDLQSFRSILLEGEIRDEIDWRKVDARYSKHLDDLEKWNIVGPPRGKVLFISNYFSVPKDDQFDRAIFNGRALSQKFFVPSGIFLPRIPEVLQLASRIVLSSKTRGFSVANYDVRHAFHHFELAPELTPYFSLKRSDGRLVSWLRLPMGWSWSPRICQSVLMSMLVFKRPEFLDIVEPMNDPPSFIFLRNGPARVGIIFLWLDNVVAVITDNDIARKLHAHLTMIGRVFGITWKTGSRLISPTEMRSKGTEFLGVEVRDLTTDKTSASALGFRHTPDRVERWKMRSVSSISTCREVFAVIGVLMWNQYVRSLSLHLIGPVIEVAQRTGRKGFKSGWNSPAHLTSEECSNLMEHFHTVLQNPYTAPSLWANELWLVTDSSSTHGAWLLLDTSGRLLDQRSWKWMGAVQSAHIFVKELLVPVMFLEQSTHTRTLIRLLIDNTAALHVLRRMYSRTKIGTELIRRADRVLTAQEVKLHVGSIRSEDNVADCPTRPSDYTFACDTCKTSSRRTVCCGQETRPGSGLCQKRMAATLERFRSEQSGHNQTSNTERGGHHHIEEVDEEDLFAKDILENLDVDLVDIDEEDLFAKDISENLDVDLVDTE